MENELLHNENELPKDQNAEVNPAANEPAVPEPPKEADVTVLPAEVHSVPVSAEPAPGGAVDVAPAAPTHEELIWQELQEAQKQKSVLEMRVLRRVKGGTVLDYKGLDVFMPLSHWHIRHTFDETEIDQALGKTIPVQVVEITPFAEKRAIASRRKLLLKERFAGITAGAVMQGKVTGITDFGAFVDLGGVEGLVHVSHLAPYHIRKPSDIVSVGQEVTVKVLKIDPKRGRMWLSMEEFVASPWTGAAERYPVGSIHKGTVTDVKKYGLYVQLEQGIDGFVHISELSWTHRIKEPADLFKAGDQVDVCVTEIKEDKKKMELSIKKAKENPWDKIAAMFSKGTLWDAKVKEVVEKGAVVELPHAVDGFLPKSKMARDRDEAPPELHAGDTLQLKVIDVSAEKQFVILAIPFQNDKENTHRHERGGRERSSKQDFPNSPRPTATLGELISEKIKQKLRMR
ncbi:MAG TPA: S1 RNA-binding domain-containing protein [Candidatus Kapabacteria bacterium]|nr:S1 RNA-binding domain-containing protein [Candidatus Kapabacteria bacterium]